MAVASLPEAIKNGFKNKELYTNILLVDRTWWRHSPHKRHAVMWSFDNFFDLRLKKGLCKLSRHRWFWTPSSPLVGYVLYIPRNMHTVFALLCFVVVIHWLIFPYSSGLLHWHCGNLKIASVPAKQPWWIWINTSCEFIMNDCITTTKQSTTKPCAYFVGYTVGRQQTWGLFY